ncbi:ABC transporter ATP-binding protein [Kytococcus sedentarius]|uniref:ABC transporter ATP-binding protein n=1 Tax=Kytococcus sedentarius TaxID=1276 RepID=UPI0035BC490B
MIRFEGVTKRFPNGTVAVDDLTLECPTGQITVLVGPSGCGKTTSLRMINRMVEPSEGQILIDGRPNTELEANELRRTIGYVIQHGGLFPHHTVLRNVMTVPLLVGWDKQKARTRALELLERVGLDPDLAQRYPAQLSGGQQQRVGVARALAADPPVMLMDEPFSAVDPIVRERLQEEFLRLQDEIGTTIVLVTHDIDEAMKLGDQVAILREGGHLAQVDSPARVMARPADDFVADFVGRDRGYRSLAFHTGEVPLQREEAVRIGDRLPRGGDWVLAVDDDSRPLGWLRTDAGELAEEDRLRLGGTLARREGSLRGLLDAALSSPSQRGVVVDDDGRLLGTVRPHDVLDVITETDRSDPGSRHDEEPDEPTRERSEGAA